VVVLTRDSAIAYLSTSTVAPITVLFIQNYLGRHASYEISDGLPSLPENVPLRPRPDDPIPSPSFWFDHETFVQKSFHF
jgi:hypothetical protein